MTKFTKAGLVAAFFFATLFSYAIDGKGDYILNIQTGNGKVVSFTLNTVEKSSFSIYDENHNLLYAGDSAANKLEVSKTISLEGLPAGTYVLEVKANDKVAKHEIKVVAKKAKTVKLDESVNESPGFRR
ncbi:Por secretion system C-terminal sorting domain-containing protein [Flavobacterium sp. CF108]|uniref:secretion protein n=1 Tax=unclassified Flavobacterium TaxID=196869 RepID=UPI0008C13CA2|nr:MULTISPECIES: secretion protein [unclassified Flavobacterium]SEO80223.1 Por secretion system C-terminal sorting domain-containing protein [Flavobacterium sp. fv08]SHG75263.1 Por secretion system C-terminal sorting domain-containing protein [Flavobacterium sp. CF108]